MKRVLAIILALALVAPCANAERKPKSHVIGFYNLENLFDTYHDDGKNDYQFLPDGQNQWTEAKYEKKLHNMATVIKAMAKDNGCWHTILGVSEIENRHVLEDLVSQPEIVAANYQIVHFDGPDRRGVDCALFYKPEYFTPIATESIPFTFEPSEIDFSAWTQEEKDNFRTRDVLMVRGTIDGEMFAFFVAHLPSRIGGKGADLRPRGAEIIYQRAAQLEKEFPGIRIVVMGDMNDNPSDVSMTKFMHGRETIDEMADGDFFSPFLSMLKAGYGSLAYQGQWNIYDIILVNGQLAKAPDNGFKIAKINKKGFYGRVFKKYFMTQQTGPYKGTPFRTFSGGAFVGGYSDHYPTYIVVTK
jgi:predicted extracellular nuclease